MCTIINREDPVSQLSRNNLQNQKSAIKNQRAQAGFTLVEVLVSLCIVIIIMHSVWQWGTVMQRTSETMAQSQEAVFLAQQILCGIEPHCPEGWAIDMVIEPSKGLLYETEITINAPQRQWHFYYVGSENTIYADV